MRARAAFLAPRALLWYDDTGKSNAQGEKRMKLVLKEKVFTLKERFNVTDEQEPVSYTHLDVYKRQIIHDAARARKGYS